MLHYTVLSYTHFTKAYTSLHLTTFIYTSHSTHPPPLIYFLSWHLADLHPTSTSLPLPSLHFTSLITFNNFSSKYSISSVLQIPFTSLHFSYHFPNLLPLYTWFSRSSKSLRFTSPINLSAPFPGNTRFPHHFEFLSFHFTYHFPHPLPKSARFRRGSP